MTPAAERVPVAPHAAGDAGARPVVAYLLSTLDGAVHAPSTWVYDDFDAEMSEHLRRVIATQDAVVMGRVTYEGWSREWPQSTREPFASFINRTPKYVASRTLRSADWPVTTILRDAAAGVRALKAQPGGEIGVHGSIALVRSLLAAGLIDTLKIVVMPVVVGAGRRLLEAGDSPQRLELIETARTAKGVTVSHYHVRKPGGATGADPLDAAAA